MRNTMTRLHGEVVRTINYFRSQQGGSPPQRIFLCGGGAHTGMVSEFFQEKFNLPVEVLNPLRGVQMDRRVDADDAHSNAASMAELVGLALRHAGSAPVEVELVPDSVAQRRDSAKRAPFLMMAMLCLFAVLGGAIFYCIQAEAVVQKNVVALKQKKEQLQKDKKSIDDLDKTFDILKGQSAQFEQTVADRGYWSRLLALLNNKFDNDYIWLTQVEVLKGGNAMTQPLTGGGQASAGLKNDVPDVPPVAGAKPASVALVPQYELRVQGLYRKNAEGAQQVVYKYFDDLKVVAEFFGPSDPENKPDVVIGLEEDRFAYQFKFRLPLALGMKFEK